MLIGEYHLSPLYVFYEIEPVEVAALLSCVDMAHRTDWERTRTLSYFIAQTHSSRALSPDELLPFPWDSGSLAGADNDNDTPLTEQQLNVMRQKAKALENMMNHTH